MNDKLDYLSAEMQPESMDEHLARYDDRDDEPQDVSGPLETDDALDGEELEAEHEAPDVSVSRRALLSGAGVAAGALAVGASSPLWLPAEAAEAHGDLARYCYVGGQRTVYEGNGSLTCFYYRPSFHTRCNYWMDLWNNNTPSSFRTPFRVWSYGVHTDHRVSTAHNNGRGFDLTRIYVTNSSGNRVRRFNGRYDWWRGTSSAATERRRYWATAGTLCYRFEYVLTYYYNSAHHNHIHFDNLVSGTGNATFSTNSPSQQVTNVQAMCRWIWGKSTTIDGYWGPQTRQHSHEVLVRIGKGGYLTSSQSHYLAFNRATCRKGYGVQSY